MSRCSSARSSTPWWTCDGLTILLRATTDPYTRPRSRRRPERQALRVAAERVAARALAAQVAVRRGRDRELVVEDAVGERADAVRELRRVVLAVGGDDRLRGTLQEAVGDRRPGCPGSQACQRVDE